MSTLRSLLSLLFTAQMVFGKSFNPCELQNQLVNSFNLTADVSRNLTCIAHKFTSLNTNVIVGDYYGLFQIKKTYCGENEAGGKCNIKCKSLLDDDISDDVLCAKKVYNKLLKRLRKSSGCRDEFENLDENCQKENNKKDYCESAMKLMTLFDISEIEALTWSCIAEFSKTGFINSSEIENDDFCVKTRDVECAIKNRKQTGFTNWPAYNLYCNNITKSLCFGIEASKLDTKINLINYLTKHLTSEETSSHVPKKFTTSTVISLIVEDEDGKTVQYNGADVTTESDRESQQTTEFLSNTLEKPSDDDNTTIEGYSRVRIMFADNDVSQSTEALKEIINGSLATTEESPTTLLSLNTEHSTNEIVRKFIDPVDKCLLAKDMKDSQLLPENLIPTFVCIAEHESGMNLSFIETDGLQSRYGLFQIDNQIYCSTNHKINTCDVLCDHLIDDQFGNDFECVRQIYKKEGLNYWPSYEKSCKNIDSSTLEHCFEKFTTSHRPFTITDEKIEHLEISTDSKIATTTELIEKSTEILVNSFIADRLEFDFCNFSYQLIVNGTDLDDLPYYMCIIDKSSELKLNLINDNEVRYGIFSLKSNTCGRDEIGGLCSLLCSDLMDDNFIDDAKCASKIYSEQGLSEWNIDTDDCKIYKAKILQCIVEDKFSLPSDEEEESSSKSNTINASMEENRKETEFTTLKTISGKFIEDEKSTVSPEDDEDIVELVSKDEMLIDATFSGIKTITEHPNEDSLIKTTNLVTEMEETTAQNEVNISVTDFNNVTELTKDDQKISNEIDQTIRRIIDEEVSKLLTSTDTTDVDESFEIETNTDYKLSDEPKSTINFTEDQTESDLKAETSTTVEDEELMKDEEPTTIVPKTSSQSILLRVPAIRFIPNYINTESTSENVQNLEYTTEYPSSMDSPYSLPLIADENEDTEISSQQLKSILPEDEFNDNFEDSSNPTTESLYYTSIGEIIDEYEKNEINITEKLSAKRATEVTFISDDMEEETTTEIFPEIFNLPSIIRTLNDFHMDICTLTQYFNESGFPHNLIPTFVCIAEYESKFNVQTVSTNGSQKKFGLFQIDDTVYCNTNEKINECDVSCGHLVDNYFENDLECVRYIYEKEGFDYWPSYDESCRNINPHSLDYCYQDFTTSHRPFTIPSYEKDRTTTKVQIKEASTEATVSIMQVQDDSGSVIRKFDLCELARIVYSFNRSVDDIPTYLCIADIKSQFQIRIPNQNDTNYGVLHINKQFCGQNMSDGLCGLKCSQLWDENLLDDIECLEKIDDANHFSIYNLTSKNCIPYTRKLLHCYDNDLFYTTERTKIENLAATSENDTAINQIEKITFGNAKPFEERTEITTISSETESQEINDEESTVKIRILATEDDQYDIETTTDNSVPKLIQFLLPPNTYHRHETTTESVTTEDPTPTVQPSNSYHSHETTTESVTTKDPTRTVLPSNSYHSHETTTESVTTKDPTPIVQNVHDVTLDSNASYQLENIIKSITNFEPKNGSTIFNIFNINIYSATPTNVN